MADVLTVIAKVRAPKRREKEGLVAGPPEVEIYRSLTE
jgi:hypothetical protein